MSNKNAIIIGASSGIGRSLAKELSAAGYTLGLTSRRQNLLESLQKQLPNKSIFIISDITEYETARKDLKALIKDLGQIDLIVINSGIGKKNIELAWEAEKKVVDVNVSGFTAMATLAMEIFINQGYGHLVGISSMASIRGNRRSPAYFASKAYVSNYLEGLRQKAVKSKLPIAVTDILPGFVATDLVKGNEEEMFWVATTEKAAKQIYQAIKKRKSKAYITKRWRLIAWVLKIVPDFIYLRI
jgi:short-subunit dehydrogenase